MCAGGGNEKGNSILQGILKRSCFQLKKHGAGKKIMYLIQDKLINLSINEN